MNYSHAKNTPMMKQWVAIKEQLNSETSEGEEPPIVFCRVGDFYELFYDDAERAAKILNIQLTKRKIADTTYPMAGVPVRALEEYSARLVHRGYRVAIIDQMEDAKKTKKTIKRELTRIITKGTVTEDILLNPGANNYIASYYFKEVKKEMVHGFAVCDLSTGDFRADEFKENNKLLRAFIKFAPVEILYDHDKKNGKKISALPIEDEQLTGVNTYYYKNSNEILSEHFRVKSLAGFGFDSDNLGLHAAGAIIKYLHETQKSSLPHINRISSFDIESTMTLDATAIKSLELFKNTNDNSSFATLYELMNQTSTPMGSRLLRHWLANPLALKHTIDERIRGVKLLIEEEMLQNHIRTTMKGIGDIERLITRISMGHAKPTELIKLANSLETLPELLSSLKIHENSFPEGLIAGINTCDDMLYLIRLSINNEPNGRVGEGKIIKEGYNVELDRQRELLKEGDKWIDKFLKTQEQLYGFSAKIKQNNSFGYFIEVSKKDHNKVPQHYQKKQAMVNYSRFFTPELKEWEVEILEAEVKILDLETHLYQSILQQLTEYTPILQKTSNSIAVIDCLSSHAYLATIRGYSKPTILEDNSFLLKGGRHPVIEAIVEDTIYTPNDVFMPYEETRLLIITGPNFSGKSSLLRMTALLAIMAQTGSYIPADEFQFGVIDRIFTRIGASDNLVAGQSTFMLEMIDAANLVNNSTQNSLVIADELGRGTSTYDGLAIAWSIAEYLHNSDWSPKILIASHYHQLAELEGLLQYCKNYHFSINFYDGMPVFNHKLIRGSSDKSFGVEVAKLAGLPDTLIDRARKILEILESKAADVNPQGISGMKLGELIIQADGTVPLSNWFDDTTSNQTPVLVNDTEKKEKHKVIVELENLNINKITPIEALQLLSQLQDMIK